MDAWFKILFMVCEQVEQKEQQQQRYINNVLLDLGRFNSWKKWGLFMGATLVGIAGFTQVITSKAGELREEIRRQPFEVSYDGCFDDPGIAQTFAVIKIQRRTFFDLLQVSLPEHTDNLSIRYGVFSPSNSFDRNQPFPATFRKYIDAERLKRNRTTVKIFRDLPDKKGDAQLIQEVLLTNPCD